MTGSGTPAKANCARGLRADRNERPVTQASQHKHKVGGGLSWYVCGCMRVFRCGSVEMTYFPLQKTWTNPHGQISTGGGGGGMESLFLDLFPFPLLLLCKPKLRQRRKPYSNLNRATLRSLLRARLNYLQFHGCLRNVLF